VNQTLLAIVSNQTWWSGFFRGFALELATNATFFGGECAAGEMALLVNAQGDSFPLAWVASHLPGSFVKFGQAGHEYQSNYERFRAAVHAPYTFSLQRANAGGVAAAAAAAAGTAGTAAAGAALRPIRARAELSAETCWTSHGPYTNLTACPQPANFYAMAQWAASARLDFWNVQPSSCGAGVTAAYAPLWRLLNRFSGLRWPSQARGAWIGFRDGLDAMDTGRFPEATFGELDLRPADSGAPDTSYPEVESNDRARARALAICAAHAAQGCRIDAPGALCGGPMEQRRAPGMNDVAFGNWRSDYGAFVTQLDPGATRGWWRVRSAAAAAASDTPPGGSFFGRFARGWARPGNASAVLPLKLDAGLWGGLPLAAAHAPALTLRLMFLDAGTGRFTLAHDAQPGAPAVLASVTKRGSGGWRELCVPVRAARFGGGGPAGADLWLLNEDEEDDIFASLEISLDNATEIAMDSCSWHSSWTTWNN
jgi:hypothetical protein